MHRSHHHADQYNGQVHITDPDEEIAFSSSETVTSHVLPVVNDAALVDQSTSLLLSNVQKLLVGDSDRVSTPMSSQPPETEVTTSLPRRHHRHRHETRTMPLNNDYNNTRHQPKARAREVGKKRKHVDVILRTTATTIDAMTSTCAGTTFNVDDYICCGGSLRIRIGVSSACCGVIAYDRFLFRCCHDDEVRMSCSADYKPKKSVWGVLV